MPSGGLSRVSGLIDRIQRGGGKVQVNANGTVSVTGSTTFGTPLVNANLNPTWTAFTPTVTQSGSVTVTVNIARHCIIGKLAHVTVHLSVTGSGTTANDITVTLPAALTSHASVPGITLPVGRAVVYDSSGPALYSCYAYLASTTTVKFVEAATQNTQSVGTGPGFGLASDDTIAFSATYEIA